MPHALCTDCPGRSILLSTPFSGEETEAQRSSSFVQGHTANKSRGAGFEFISFGLQYPSFAYHMCGHACPGVRPLVNSRISPRIQKLNQIWVFVF